MWITYDWFETTYIFSSFYLTFRFIYKLPRSCRSYELECFDYLWYHVYALSSLLYLKSGNWREKSYFHDLTSNFEFQILTVTKIYRNFCFSDRKICNSELPSWIHGVNSCRRRGILLALKYRSETIVEWKYALFSEGF